jgi:hypothetical protein
MSQSRSTAPTLGLILLNMGTSWREAAPGVLDDFAAVGTFLLNCEGSGLVTRHTAEGPKDRIECRG